MFDPYVPELSPVNTVICEQSFAWSNQYSNVKSMNGPRFFSLLARFAQPEGNIESLFEILQCFN